MFVDGRKMGSGSLYTVMDLCEDRTGVGAWVVGRLGLCLCHSLLQMLPRADSTTHPDRVHQAATGMCMANDKQDKLSPMMSHYYTCL